MGGGSSSGGDQRNEIRYAPYIESKHQSFLDSVQSNRITIAADSPFADNTDIEIDDAFFGASFTIASFPSLYDMFGKFMAGLDIDVLFSQIFEDTVNSPEINNLVAAETALLDDDFNANVLPNFTLGARDINAVQNDSFVVGKAVLLDGRTKAVERFSSELKYRMIPVAVDRWKTHLGWNGQVVMNYAEIMKLWFSAKMDVDDYNYTLSTKDKLWPFTVLDYERAALGALQGARSSKGVGGASTTQKAIAGALTGAAGGAMLGNMMAPAGATGLAALGGPWALGIGAAIGIGSAFL
jgi:hypothetical protein